MALHDGPNGYQVLASAPTGRRTNWESGLAAVGALGAPELVVFVTDGLPSAWVDDVGANVDAPDTVQGMSEAALHARVPVQQLQKAGTHILGIAIGPLTGEVTRANYRTDAPLALRTLVDLVEPTATSLNFYYPEANGEAATFDVVHDDVVLVNNFERLSNRLRQLASRQCRSSASSPASSQTELPPTGPGLTSNIIGFGLLLVSIGSGLRLLSGRPITSKGRAKAPN